MEKIMIEGPTLALIEIRELIRARGNTAPIMTVDEALHNGYRLAQLIQAVDEHVSNGGGLPEQWAAPMAEIREGRRVDGP